MTKTHIKDGKYYFTASPPNMNIHLQIVDINIHKYLLFV